MYCLIKHQYYWEGMNKDIRKYIANLHPLQMRQTKVQQYPLQMTETLTGHLIKSLLTWSLTVRPPLQAISTY